MLSVSRADLSEMEVRRALSSRSNARWSAVRRRLPSRTDGSNLFREEIKVGPWLGRWLPCLFWLGAIGSDGADPTTSVG
jgi:hypothetical protein